MKKGLIIDVSRCIYKRREFNVYSTYEGYVVHNTKKEFKNGHTHVNSYATALKLVNISIEKEIPDYLNKYLLGSLLRLTDDYKFRNKIESKFNI